MPRNKYIFVLVSENGHQISSTHPKRHVTVHAHTVTHKHTNMGEALTCDVDPDSLRHVFHQRRRRRIIRSVADAPRSVHFRITAIRRRNEVRPELIRIERPPRGRFVVVLDLDDLAENDEKKREKHGKNDF